MRFAVPYLGLVLLAPLGIACSSTSSTPTSEEGCLDSLSPVQNTEFCEDMATETDCGLVTGKFAHQACGVALKDPPGDLERSSSVEEFAGSGPPDLSCFTPASYPPSPGPSESVTLKGIVKIFSNGCQSNDVVIEAYTVKRGGSPEEEGSLGPLIGEAVVTASDCEAEGVFSDDEKCGERYECTYTYPDIPTETELVIKTSGDRWAPLYQYNIFVPNEEVVDGEWEQDLRSLIDGDYTAIPQVAIGTPVTAGNGVVAGEIHDCDDVRLTNAVADIDKDKFITTYFTANEERPLPDTGATGTSILSLYSAMDVDPGPVTVAAAGRVNGEMVSIGFMTVQIFPDAVTSLTFRGLSRFQVPE